MGEVVSGLLRLVSVLGVLSFSPTFAQGFVVGDDGSITFLGGDAPPMEMPSGGSAESDDDSEGEPSEREKQLVALTYDRRPSTILRVWSTPEEEEEEEGETEADEPETAVEAAEEAEGTEEVEEPEPEPFGPPDAAVVEARKQEEQAAAAAAEQERAAEEAAEFERRLEQVQRDVTLGEWPAVGEFLATLTEREGKAAFRQILTSLVEGPKEKPPVPQQGKPYLEKNRISPGDVLGLAEACPVELEKGLLEKLGQLLAQALTAGHHLEAFLEDLEPRLGDEEFALSRRHVARLLTFAGRPFELGDYLPSADEAIANDDREGLNLLSRHYLARYEEEGLTEWLESAWKVTLAVLAVGEVEAEEKAEALTRAVGLAPRLRDELGLAWLEESFTTRPERGMEVISVIGSKASKALSELPMDADQRLELLELQSTAVHALLEAAPGRGAAWRRELGLLAEAWLREAEYTYARDESTSRGPIMQRDPWGNMFYFNSGPRSGGNTPPPIATGDILDVRMRESWLQHLDETLRPRILMMYAQLFLKVSEGTEAFPYIERVAVDYPGTAQELVDEFLRVWAKNNDPNKDRNHSIYIFGYNQRATGIPLTRSKQDRNLAQLGEWVARLRQLPVELDEELVTTAFTKAHSSAEVYRLETIEQIFGPLGELEPSTLAALLQRMRSNLVDIWRDPAIQEEKKTNRRRADIEAEILRGYELAESTLTAAIEKHPESWELLLARACLAHDQNNYAKELAPDAETSSRRREALADFALAASHYTNEVETLTKDDESIAVFEHWFYAALGASDLGKVRPEMTLATAQIPLIREALASLPGEAADRHLEKFASTLFTRMSGANPGVKFRYVEQGLAIVGEHELARDARQIHDYYTDLVHEIELDVRIDGADTVGHTEPFGLVVDIRHTKQIERESGGFGKYLQNQNASNMGFNFGRPTEDYRDRFEEGVREALEEHFEVVSVTFNDPKARSRAEPEYGWRVTPYAYVLLVPRGPQVDLVGGLRLDLDFLDTTGYAVLPVESSPIPIDASAEVGTARPYEELRLTQRLDERQASDGRLALELEVTARGLVPGLDALVDLESEGFEVVGTEDSGVAVVEFADDGRAVRSHRVWTVDYRAREGLAELPEEFAFATPLEEPAALEHYRYADADLVAVDPVVSLEQRYGEVSRTWMWWIPVGVLAAVGVVTLARRRRPASAGATVDRFQVPDPLTPFSVLGFLRGIQEDDALPAEARRELSHEIDGIEQYFFVEGEGREPDLRGIATAWTERVHAG